MSDTWLDDRLDGPAWKLIVTGATLRFVWRIPLIVGTLLTVVNQTGSLLDGRYTMAAVAVAANYATPYVVSSLGFLTFQRIKVNREPTEPTNEPSAVTEPEATAPEEPSLISDAAPAPEPEPEPAAPFEWIVNSNALGVAFLPRKDQFRISFLSRHAVRRLADGTLVGQSADELLGQEATTLADVRELQLATLQDPGNYPTTATAEIGERHIEFAISSVMSDGDEYLGAMLTFKDVSELKRLERENAEFQSQVSLHTSDARVEADKTEALAQGLNGAVSTVKGNGREIAELLGHLEGLNGQTRMLSLNASIEASRAGMAGNAFRVIADEVGDLAQRTQNIGGEVRGILDTIDGDSDHAYECAVSLSESVAALVTAQRALDEEVQSRI